MGASNGPVYLVNTQSDPVLIRVRGRVSFMNSHLIRDFFEQSMKKGVRRFAVDFTECTGMDSTFLGALAGAALELRKAVPRGSLVFCRLGPRNLELVRNLGLHRLATVDCGLAVPASGDMRGMALEGSKLSEAEAARHCLEAHEALVRVDPENEAKFRDVIELFREQAGGN